MPHSLILMGKLLRGLSLVTLPLPISMNMNIYQVQIKRYVTALTNPQIFTFINIKNLNKAQIRKR